MLRLFPILGVFLMVALVFRVTGFGITDAVAESKPSKEAVKETMGKPMELSKADPTEEKMAKEEKVASLDMPETLLKKAAEQAEKETPIDPTEFSASELELLQSLRGRREELRKREQQIEQRERVLASLEHRIEGKIAELNGIKTQMTNIRGDIDEKAKKFEKNEDKRIASLVRVYEKMKPKDAAAIFNDLDEMILLDVVKGMKESKIAPILASMSPKKAQQITEQLGTREDLPLLSAE